MAVFADSSIVCLLCCAAGDESSCLFPWKNDAAVTAVPAAVARGREAVLKC